MIPGRRTGRVPPAPQRGRGGRRARASGSRAALAHALAGVSLALAMAAGCAPMTSPPLSPPVPAVPGPEERAVESTPPRAEPAPRGARVDTLPSPEAERVLATIPEPLPGAARTSAASDTARSRVFVAPEAAYDTLRIERTPEEQAAGVPVPAPTRPLGSPSPVAVEPADSLAARPGAPGSPAPVAPAQAAPSPSAAGPPADAAGAAPRPAPAGAAPVTAAGPCWRVQVAAPATREEADSRHAAAQSLLVAGMVVEPEKGLFKVRTRGCLSREAALALRQRALDSGFEGSFLVDTGTPARPAPPPARAKPRRSGARR